MENEERIAEIQRLNSEIAPLRQKELLASLRFYYLKNPHRQVINDNDNIEIEGLQKELNELNSELKSYSFKLRKLQIEYIVSYEGIVLEGSSTTSNQEVKSLFLSTDVEIDSLTQNIDYTNADVLKLIAEISNYISNTYSDFHIKDIKRK